MSDFLMAAFIVVGLIVAYGWGYRSGVAYCMKQLGPLEEAARELHRMMGRK